MGHAARADGRVEAGAGQPDGAQLAGGEEPRHPPHGVGGEAEEGQRRVVRRRGGEGRAEVGLRSGAGRRRGLLVPPPSCLVWSLAALRSSARLLASRRRCSLSSLVRAIVGGYGGEEYIGDAVQVESIKAVFLLILLRCKYLL